MKQGRGRCYSGYYISVIIITVIFSLITFLFSNHQSHARTTEFGGYLRKCDCNNRRRKDLRRSATITSKCSVVLAVVCPTSVCRVMLCCTVLPLLCLDLYLCLSLLLSLLDSWSVYLVFLQIFMRSLIITNNSNNNNTNHRNKVIIEFIIIIIALLLLLFLCSI